LDPRDRGIVVHFLTQNDVIENSIGSSPELLLEKKISCSITLKEFNASDSNFEDLISCLL